VQRSEVEGLQDHALFQMVPADDGQNARNELLRGSQFGPQRRDLAIVERMWRGIAIASAAVLMFGWQAAPRFQDFQVAIQWSGASAAVKLRRPDERLFRTRLDAGAREPANFADHYRLVGWGCGSVCAAGALLDLQTGEVYPPPKRTEATGWERWIFAGGVVDGPFIEVRRDSRMVVVRQQAQDPASQELSFYEWTGAKFRFLSARIERKLESRGSPKLR
jgi:hypothetical protein